MPRRKVTQTCLWAVLHMARKNGIPQNGALDGTKKEETRLLLSLALDPWRDFAGQVPLHQKSGKAGPDKSARCRELRAQGLIKWGCIMGTGNIPEMGFSLSQVQGSLKDLHFAHLKHGFFHQNKWKPPFTGQCSGV